MAVCVNCGVEIDDGLNVCPLCGKDPAVRDEQETQSFKYPSDIIQLSRKEIRRSLWELSGVITFSVIAVCTIVDLIISKSLAWSLIVDVLVIGAWLMMTLFLYAYKRTWVIIPGAMITILAALLLIDLIAPGRNWFFPLGLPLTASAFFAAGILIILYRTANLKGLNIIAAAFMVLSGFCIITEIVLDNYMNGKVDLRWSLIAAISILPVVLILFYYHYRLKKGNALDRFLHI